MARRVEAFPFLEAGTQAACSPGPAQLAEHFQVASVQTRLSHTPQAIQACSLVRVTLVAFFRARAQRREHFRAAPALELVIHNVWPAVGCADERDAAITSRGLSENELIGPRQILARAIRFGT